MPFSGIPGSSSAQPGRLIPGSTTTGVGGPAQPTRTVPASASFSGTRSRTVVATGRLFLLGQTRTVPATGRLAVQRVVAVRASLRATLSRTVPATRQLRATSSRTVPASGVFRFTGARPVPATAQFSWSARRFYAQASLSGFNLPTSKLGLADSDLGAHGFTLGSGALIRQRVVPATAALQYVTTRARVTQDYVEALEVGQPYARATQVFPEALIQPPSTARVSQVLPEALIQPPAQARVTQVLPEAVIAPPSRARATEVYVEVLIADQILRFVPATARFANQLTTISKRVPATGVFSYTAPTTTPLTTYRAVPATRAISNYLGVAQSLGPTALYLLNEPSGTTAFDSSGNAHHGTWNGSPLLGQAGPSSDLLAAANFNNAGYIDAPLNTIDWSVAGITWGAWVNPTGATSFARFFDFGIGASSDNIIVYRNSTSDDLAVFVANGSTSASVVFSGLLASNQGWFYLAVSITPSGLVNVWKDGRYIGSGQVQSIRAGVTRTHCYIGRDNWGSVAPTSYVAGRGAGFFFAARVLAPAEIQRLTTAASGDQNARVTETPVEVVSPNPLSNVRVTESAVEVVGPTPPSYVRVSEAPIEIVGPNPTGYVRTSEAPIEVVTQPAGGNVRATEVAIEIVSFGKEQYVRVVAATASLGLHRRVPASAVFWYSGAYRTVPAIGAVGVRAYVTQAALEIVTQGARAMVTQAPIEVLFTTLRQTRLVPATARFTKPRTIPATGVFSVQPNRTVPATGRFRSTSSRTIPASAAFRATLQREVPATARPGATYTRIVPASGVLSTPRYVPSAGAFQATFSRSVPASAALLATLGRSVPAQFRASADRYVPITAVFGAERHVPAVAALQGTRSRRVIARTIIAPPGYLFHLVRYVPVSGVFTPGGGGLRHVPVTAEFVTAQPGRWVPASAPIGFWREVPVTGVLSTHSERTVPATSSIGRWREVPITAQIRRTWGRSVHITAWFYVAGYIPATAVFISNRRFVPAKASFWMDPLVVIANEVQTLTIGGIPTGGTFTLTVGGFTTAPIAWSSDSIILAANIQAALRALPNIGPAGVTVTVGTMVGGVGTLLITFTNDGVFVPLITVSNNSLTGTDPTISLAMTTAAANRLVTPSDNTLWRPTGSPGCISLVSGIKSSPVNTVTVSEASHIMGGIVQYTGFPIGPYVLWDPPEAIPGPIPPDWNFTDYDDSAWQAPVWQPGSPIPWPGGSSDIDGLNFNWGPDSPTDAGRSQLLFPYTDAHFLGEGNPPQWTDPWDDVVMFRARLGLPDDPGLVAQLSAVLKVAEVGFLSRIFAVTLNGLALPFSYWDMGWDISAELLGTWEIPQGWLRPGDNIIGIVTGTYLSWPLDYYSRMTSFRLDLNYCRPVPPIRRRNFVQVI